LFVLGCDATSKVYGIGKVIALCKIQRGELPKLANFFIEGNAKKKDIVKAGEKSLILLYNSDPKDGLDVLWYKRFSEKLLKCFKYVEARDLPPTVV